MRRTVRFLGDSGESFQRGVMPGAFLGGFIGLVPGRLLGLVLGGGHYGELPKALRARLEARAGGLARLVLDRFPGLVLAVWRTEAELRA